MPIKTTYKYALLSVWDKTGIVDFAKEISALGFKIISSGGTAKTLADAGIKVIPIQEITGNPEMLVNTAFIDSGFGCVLSGDMAIFYAKWSHNANYKMF